MEIAGRPAKKAKMEMEMGKEPQPQPQPKTMMMPPGGEKCFIHFTCKVSELTRTTKSWGRAVLATL